MTNFSFDHVLVLGAGTMGRGIAQVAAATGSRVTLIDADETRARAAHDAIAQSLERAVAKGKVAAPERQRILDAIRPSSDLDGAAVEADVVVEAVPEKIEIKRAIFARLGALCPSHALLGSNTSSLSIASIAEDCPAPERLVGLHFFNPVPVMALIEIVHAPKTAQQTVDAAIAFSLRLGKDPILVRDSPGFATSRLGVLLGLEAMRMVEEEVASAADIDKAMKLGYRHPMGPLELTDLVGLDVRLAIAQHLHRELGSETFRPPAILERMVAEGKLGKKSGQGFYNYDA